MSKDKINMPMSGAGLTRYFDDYRSKIEFKPGHIIFMAVLVVVIVLMLHVWGNSLFNP
jgi:preprotein translocase subunit Sec61beta